MLDTSSERVPLDKLTFRNTFANVGQVEALKHLSLRKEDRCGVDVGYSPGEWAQKGAQGRHRSCDLNPTARLCNFPTSLQRCGT